MGDQLVLARIPHRREPEQDRMVALLARQLGLANRLLRAPDRAGHHEGLARMARGFLRR